MSRPSRLLGRAATREALASLRKAHRRSEAAYPGDSGARQPVHTYYLGAHQFEAETAPKLGASALAALREHAPQADTLASVLGLDREAAPTIHARVAAKLAHEPVEDLRIDFEDGYANRSDAEEDRHAALTASEAARAAGHGWLPAFFGIRIKPLSRDLAERSLRTLDIFVATLLAEQGRRGLVDRFVVTLPKVVAPEQVAVLARALRSLERRGRLPAGSLALELMVETTQSVLAPDGAVALPALVAAAGGRCRGAHFGTYDFTAACGITAAHQTMAHPACDFARSVMQVALAGTGVRLSDGGTNVLPAGPDTAAVHRAWRLHYDHVRHSLVRAFYQGWDLHPAQLATRYAAVYAFFREGLPAASRRLRQFLETAGEAARVGDVMDDAATGQGLLNFFLRALSCGAVDAAELEPAGLTPAELETRSFARILERRRASVAP